MLRSLLCSCLLILLSAGVAAQKRSPPDKITFSDGTEKAVDLQRGGGYYLGKAIGVREEGEQGFRDLSPLTVSEFTFGRSNRTYRAVDVDIPNQKRSGVREPKRRFGEVLADGDVELIRVNLASDEYETAAVGIEPYMYLLREGDVELPLELTTIMVYEILNANPSRFRNKLKFFARDCPEARQYAEDIRFNDGDILRVVDDYAACKGLNGVEVNERRVSGKLQLSHFGRFTVLDMRDANYSQRQLSVGLGYQGEAAFTNKMRWLGVLLSTDYVYQSFKWEGQSNVQQSMFKSNLSLALKPIRQEFSSFQVFAGLSNYNATSSSFRSFFNNNYFLLSSGLRFRSHGYLVELHYEHMPNQIKEQPGNILLVSFGYKFAGR